MDARRPPETQYEGDLSHAASQHAHAVEPSDVYTHVYSPHATPGEEVSLLVPIWPKKESVEKLLRTVANRYKAAASTIVGMVGLGADLFKGEKESVNYNHDSYADAGTASGDDIVTSYDTVGEDTYASRQYPPPANSLPTTEHPYYTTFESHPYYTYFEPSPYRIPTEDETYAEWYYQQQQQGRNSKQTKEHELIPKI